MSAHKNIAVVLFNLGGPDSKESIQPFLFNFFMDPNIIPLPKPLRWMIAKLIAHTRSRKEAGTSYARLNNKSPLLDNTQAQAQALQDILGPQYKVYICMRYWHPMAQSVARQVKADNPDKIILLPLYPQFSTATTWSSLQDWQNACKDVDMDIPSTMICCYPGEPGFVAASADLVAQHYMAMKQTADAQGLKAPRILFSAHGLPEDIIRSGDPYQWQCEKTAEIIASRINIPHLDWGICYQSRVGPKKWIGPSTEEALRQAASDGVPVLIYPHAFVSEHVETLVEIEEEYRELAQHIGIPMFGRVPTVSVHQAFVQGLAAMVLARADHTGIASDTGGRICPSGFTRCCMGQGVALDGARACTVLSPQTMAG